MTLRSEKKIIKSMFIVVVLSLVTLFVVLFSGVPSNIFGVIYIGILLLVFVMKVKILITLWKDYCYKKDHL